MLVVDRGASECKTPVVLTPLFDMREKMGLGLLSDPGGFSEGGNELAGPWDQLLGVPDAETTLVTVPTTRHRRRLHARPSAKSASYRRVSARICR